MPPQTAPQNKSCKKQEEHRLGLRNAFFVVCAFILWIAAIYLGSSDSFINRHAEKKIYNNINTLATLQWQVENLSSVLAQAITAQDSGALETADDAISYRMRTIKNSLEQLKTSAVAASLIEKVAQHVAHIENAALRLVQINKSRVHNKTLFLKQDEYLQSIRNTAPEVHAWYLKHLDDILRINRAIMLSERLSSRHLKSLRQACIEELHTNHADICGSFNKLLQHAFSTVEYGRLSRNITLRMQTESTILSGLATQLHTHLHNALSEKHTQHQNMEIALLFAAFLVSCITMFGLYFPASSTPKKQKKHTDHPANNQEDLLHANAPPRTVHQSLQLILLNAFDDNPAAFAIVNLLTDRIKYQNAAFKCLCETHKIHIDTLTALIYRQYENGYHNLKNFVVPIAVTAEEHNNLFMDYATYLADDKLLCSIHIGQSPRSHAAPRLIDRHVDDLTQACTRQRFVQKMSEAITMQAICVIAVDINKFADINRTYGFKSADNILIHLVQDLPHMIFGETQKADDSFIGRLDSNLFAIAYPAPKTIHTDLDTLKQRIEQAPYLDENGDAIFISVRTAHLTIHKIEDQAEKNIITEDRLQQLEMMLSRHLM